MLVKVVVEALIRTNSISSVEQIPFSISRLLYLASNRSDQTVERELFENYCMESNKILVEEIGHYQDKVDIFEKIQGLVPGLVDSEQAAAQVRAQVGPTRSGEGAEDDLGRSQPLPVLHTQNASLLHTRTRTQFGARFR